jgi:putative FmdB family regulatory protein
MPIYEYQCQACGHRLETMQRFSDAPLTDCPECGAAQLRKLVSAAAFQLKGTGWYVTDFRDGGKGKGKSADGGSGSPGEASGTGTGTAEKSTDSGGSDGATTKEKPAKAPDSVPATK